MSSALERLRNKNKVKEEAVTKEQVASAVVEEVRETSMENEVQHGQRLHQPQGRFEQPVYEPQGRFEQHTYRGNEGNYQGYPVHNEIPNEREVAYHEPRYEQMVHQYPSEQVHQQEIYDEYQYAQQHMKDTNKPLHVLQVPSKVSYGTPDKVGLSVIGVNDPAKVRLLKPAPLDVQPLVLNNIRDTTGAISNRLVKIMKDTGCTVLPLRECNIFDSITSIPDFDIIQVRGKRYASYTGLDYPTTYLETLIKRITDKILIAQPYGVELDVDLNNYTIDPTEAVLSRKVQINGSTVEVPSLCISQLNYIYAYFRNYNCNVIDVTDDFPRLVVGIDLEGIPCEINRNSGYNVAM